MSIRINNTSAFQNRLQHKRAWEAAAKARVDGVKPNNEVCPIVGKPRATILSIYMFALNTNCEPHANEAQDMADSLGVPVDFVNTLSMWITAILTHPGVDEYSRAQRFVLSTLEAMSLGADYTLITPAIFRESVTALQASIDLQMPRAEVPAASDWLALGQDIGMLADGELEFFTLAFLSGITKLGMYFMHRTRHQMMHMAKNNPEQVRAIQAGARAAHEAEQAVAAQQRKAKAGGQN